MPTPAEVTRLSDSTRSTGHTTKVSNSTSTIPAVAPTASSARASRASGPAGARATVAIGSARREAAVDDQLGASHERGLVTGQEQRDVRNLARLRDAAERDARLELLADGVGQVRRLKRRVHDARMDDVAADLVARELDGERLRQRDQ